MKTINKGVLSMFINLSTFTKNPTSCPKVQLRYSAVFFYLQTQVIKQYHWNGLDLKKQHHTLSTPFIFCSSSLYDDVIIKKLKAEFKSLLASKSETETTISWFHKKYFFYKNHPIYLKRSSDIQTVSKTTILKNKNGSRLNYTDLVEISEQTIQI